MATRLASPCREPGCPNLAGRRGHCKQHERAYERQRGSAAARGYGAAWRRQRAEFLAENPFCACGAPATTVDHRIPLRLGGADHPDNFQAMCKSCHSRKTVIDGRWRRAAQNN